MGDMDAESIRTIVTSPPYNLNNTTGGGMAASKNVGKWKPSESSEWLGEGYARRKKTKEVPYVPYEGGGIVHGDCLEVMGDMDDGSVQTVVTSPPYNLRTKARGTVRSDKGWKGKWVNATVEGGIDHGYEESHSDNMPHDDYVAWQRECLAAMMRLLREDGAIFYNHKWRVQKGLLQDRSDIVGGFPVRQIIIWQRSGGHNFNEGYFLPNYEVVYLIAKPDFKLLPKANAIGCVWKIHQETKNPHPAPFPVELARKCVASVPHGLVLDPFFGSGTTGLAAMELGYPCIGIEKSAKYVKMALKRINDAKGTAPRGKLF